MRPLDPQSSDNAPLVALAAKMSEDILRAFERRLFTANGKPCPEAMAFVLLVTAGRVLGRHGPKTTSWQELWNQWTSRSLFKVFRLGVAFERPDARPPERPVVTTIRTVRPSPRSYWWRY